MDSKLYSRKAVLTLATALRLIGKLPLFAVIILLQSIIWAGFIINFSFTTTILSSQLGYKKMVWYLRKRFEHQASRQIIGWNLACATIVISIVAPRAVWGNDFVDAPLEGQTLSEEAISLTTELSIRSPLGHTYLTQGYQTGHLALDLKGQIGDPVYPVMRGTVVEVSAMQGGYGNMVRIDHGKGIESLYAHLSAFKTRHGAEVTTESVIGLVGSTGKSTGPHLHLEVIDQGRKINPMTIIGGRF